MHFRVRDAISIHSWPSEKAGFPTRSRRADGLSQDHGLASRGQIKEVASRGPASLRHLDRDRGDGGR